MIDYGFIVDEDRVVQASLLYGTASAANYRLESITFVDEPFIQQAQTIKKTTF